MDNLLRNLKTAIFNVMETMYFLVPDEENGGEIADGLTAYIGVTGAPNYRLSLTFDRELVRMMAVDLLGVDEDDLDDDLVYKCLSETANVVAGNYLLSFSEDENRNVTLPCMDREQVFDGGSSTDPVMVEMSFNGFGVHAELESVAYD